MKKMTLASLLSAATVFVAPFFAKAKPTLTLTAPTLDLDAHRAAAPRAVAGLVRAKAQTAEELIAEMQGDFKAFKEKLEQQAKDGDPLISAEIDKINANLSQLTQAYEQTQQALAAARLGGGASGALSPEAAAHSNAFNSWFRKGLEPESLHDLAVKASLTTQVDPDGGYLVPEQMDTEIDRVLSTVSAMRGLARVINLGTGNSYTKLINQGGTTSGWVGEEEARPETTGPKLAQIKIDLHEIYANPAATQTLLDDARIDIASWLAEEVSIEFAEEEGAAFINGDGIKRPKGFMTESKVANASYAWGKLGFVVSGAASTFATPSGTVSPADCLISLYYALKAGYRGNAAWMMSDATLGTVRSMKDGQGNFLWAPPTAAGEVPTILQKPVYTDDNLDQIGANKFPIAFGDFKRGYTIADKGGVRVLRDPFSNKPYVHFYTTKRVGGRVTNFEAIKLLKIST